MTKFRAGYGRILPTNCRPNAVYELDLVVCRGWVANIYSNKVTAYCSGHVFGVYLYVLGN